MTKITTTALRIEVCKLSRDTLSALDRSLYPQDSVGIPSGYPRETLKTLSGHPRDQHGCPYFSRY